MLKRRTRFGLAKAAILFSVLGDETRLALLKQLSESGPSSISSLSESFQMTRQAVTKHLNLLAGAGLIDGRREGREHVWMVKPGSLAEAQRCLDIIARGWDDALDRLKAHVEKG